MADGDEEAYTPCRPAAPNLSSEWPKLKEPIYREFRKHGMAHEQAEDLTQEVAARMIGAVPQHPGPSGFLRLARRVARSVWIDQLRANDRRPRLVELADNDAGVLDIDALEKVVALAALQQLTSSERAILFDAADGPQTANDHLRKHRARRRLEMIMSGLAGILVVLRKALSRGPRHVAPAVAAIALVTAVVLTIENRLAPHEPQLQEDATAFLPPPDTIETPTSPRPGTAPSPRTPSSTLPPYEELLSVPPSSRELSALGIPLGELKTSPTKNGDSIFCYYNAPLLGDVCVGDAPSIGRLIRALLH